MLICCRNMSSSWSLSFSRTVHVSSQFLFLHNFVFWGLKYLLQNNVFYAQTFQEEYQWNFNIFSIHKFLSKTTTIFVSCKVFCFFWKIINFMISRWGLGGNYCEGGGDVLQMKEEDLCEYLESKIVKDLMGVTNILSDLQIPGHLSIILILIVIFSRDGISMEGHSTVDAARSYYLQLLYRYMKLTNTQSSRLNASLHSILKTVKDYGEAIRSQFVLNFDWKSWR